MKLLICDDDISTVDVVQNQLNCQELGITRILRAYNGEAAKTLILEEKPELILCDIGMPKCNGLEVLRSIRQQGIDSEFAFLTCYESFEYAREAIRYGASNYLSKPLDFDELKVALNRMIHTAKAKRQQQETAEDQGIRDNRINNLLRQISTGFFGTDRERIDKILRRNRLGFTADSRWRLVCSAGDMSRARKEGWARELILFSFGRMVEEVLTENIGAAYTIVNSGDKFVHTICFVPEELCSEQELLQRCRRLAQLCAANMHICPNSVVSEPIMLYRTYEIVDETMNRCSKLRFQSGMVYPFRETNVLEENLNSMLDDQEVTLYIRTRNRDRFGEMMDTVLDKIVHLRGSADAMMNMLYQDLRFAFSNCLRDNRLSPRTVFEEAELRYLDANAVRSQSDMKLFAMTLYDRTIEKLQEQADSTDIIAGVRGFIQEHYREDIDRDTIAAMAYITPNYLSKRFRTEMGMNLREYINQLRIEEAIRLLLSTNDAVSEIASKVGYANISYFSTVFRKQCGMSPIDWRSKTTDGGGKA